MRRTVRIGLAAVVVVVGSATAVPAGAVPPPPVPHMWVSPSRALQDGQTVGVSGSGFAGDARIVGLAQCPTGAWFATDCRGQQVVAAHRGSFGANFHVQRMIGRTDCAAAPGACVIGATNLGGSVGAFTQTAFIRLRFGPPATVLQTTLSGRREIGPDGAPAAGALDAVGAATVTVRSTSVCAALTVTGVELPALAAHVHRARAGENGPIVIPLRPPQARGRSQACVDGLDPVLLADLTSHPHRFYVNIHSAAFPDGAVRGQLERADREGPMEAAVLRGNDVIGPSGRRGVGDPAAVGVVTATTDSVRDRICVELWVRGLSGAVAARIHEGDPATNGGVVVDLPAPNAAGRSSACVVVGDFVSVSEIETGHGFFSVDVHTTQHPEGAVRGPLLAAAALAG
jgi:hypothetical protein